MDGITDWLIPIVVGPKPNNEISLCMDCTRLNKAVLGPYYPKYKIVKYFRKLMQTKDFIRSNCVGKVSY